MVAVVKPSPKVAVVCPWAVVWFVAAVAVAAVVGAVEVDGVCDRSGCGLGWAGLGLS